jgi:ATP-dependent helicase YprA (DUF1998 family)
MALATQPPCLPRLRWTTCCCTAPTACCSVAGSSAAGSRLTSSARSGPPWPPGESGLLHATTGSGKTYAVWLGALARARATRPGLQVLWLTPMRALAADTTRALQLPLADLAPAGAVGQRTGDTPSAERARQDKRLPAALVTTPESLSLMLTRESARRRPGRRAHRDRRRMA